MCWVKDCNHGPVDVTPMAILLGEHDESWDLNNIKSRQR